MTKKYVPTTSQGFLPLGNYISSLEPQLFRTLKFELFHGDSNKKILQIHRCWNPWASRAMINIITLTLTLKRHPKNDTVA